MVSFGRSGGVMEGLEATFFATDSTRSPRRNICKRGCSVESERRQEAISETTEEREEPIFF